ncbi:heme exporter protein CcmD [Pseudosulfitobacter pseudonitzschiae]|uniref:Heme exporter protein D n=2 Tax=Pseudosulfitobacter pseudonitzschiae TaxID=1402135 RepID=A0A073JD20_9RHOB|nr:heme exporter protein CcmD [Pseudosulfitobacter pseudonitzschiae]KEJ95617.1 hemagglutination activity protein [Pseudosulfitobacter pseudonitzschiae]MBM1813541.1 heme exporter protein CcmD [Pseudosulfitobacter pseudonitzschiae]MBM1830534.1 heme exporter protein CcmD [Pseudosulfitobacter pseudonitzschiae]MBM1835401.1 heme exporter protein CcmD [Pseudosulfitobacter pseudonitzschiae]MBM1840247.1 heme exporter protein CcmD [Pseudosulfitobacter pseudonitzschiae]
MMPELGKYAVAVLSAYGATAVLLIVLVTATLLRGRRVRDEMQRTEARGRKDA